MVSVVYSLGLLGISGYAVTAECFLSGGLPSFDVVGLPDSAVKEARERVRAAVKNCGLNFPASRITVNLAPADLKKGGTVYDLPIMLGILAASEQVKSLPSDAAYIGELSLAGDLRPIPGTLPMALAAARAGMTKLFVPADNAAEASLASGLTVYPVNNVNELISHHRGEKLIEPTSRPSFENEMADGPDFADVKGQENVKRALEIAAAGNHNILLSGPPGAGKSMLAKRLPSILPALSWDEAIEATEVHSVMGLTSRERPLLLTRPFRSPHHTVSAIGMSGGGAGLRPGEISLAHNGVLFLDELPEFSKQTLEVLRQPLEDGEVTITRVTGSVSYPSRFMLVCAMNPCRCGWYGHSSRRCKCSEPAVKAYHSRISGPLLDRIDIHVEVPAVEYKELSHRGSGESSGEVRARVNRARGVQRERFGPDGPASNAYMGTKELSEYCVMDDECNNLMKSAFDRLGLTARSYDRILRVARTIADLDESGRIGPAHLAEAIQYRSYDFREEE